MRGKESGSRAVRYAVIAGLAALAGGCTWVKLTEPGMGVRVGTVAQVSNPARLPDPTLIEEIREPIIATKIFVPQEFVGPVITLCTQKRGT